MFRELLLRRRRQRCKRVLQKAQARISSMEGGLTNVRLLLKIPLRRDTKKTDAKIGTENTGNLK